MDFSTEFKNPAAIKKEWGNIQTTFGTKCCEFIFQIAAAPEKDLTEAETKEIESWLKTNHLPEFLEDAIGTYVKVSYNNL